MIGVKVDVSAYEANGKAKRNNKDFTLEEILLSHFDNLQQVQKK